MKTLTLPLRDQSEPIYMISDLHANFPALEAVLNAIPKSSLIICAGDIVGYYLDPNEVCALLQERSVLCVQGNHDKYVLGELNYPRAREAKYRIKLTRQLLTPYNRVWLEGLPDFLFLESNHNTTKTSKSLDMQVTHGSTRNVEEYVYPDTPIDFLTDDFPTYTILGHTHHPMIRNEKGRYIVNPGSVGQPRDRIPSASFASVDPTTGEVKFYRAAYSIATYQKRLLEAGVDDDMIHILSRKQNESSV